MGQDVSIPLRYVTRATLDNRDHASLLSDRESEVVALRAEVRRLRVLRSCLMEMVGQGAREKIEEALS